MSRQNRGHGNAVAESFSVRLKRERTKNKFHGTREAARGNSKNSLVLNLKG
ncbi:hypothetical protein [Atlantibacter hermannii]|uniref:hypothetical protein n=1 Tax=Atlantibacter hermannii TaxID=565 RepID=UPI0016501002